MAHELYIRKDGKAAMMYVDKLPWQGVWALTRQSSRFITLAN